MNPSFEHHLQTAFKTLPSGYIAEVRSMACAPEPFKLFGNSSSNKEHDAQHTKRLVLVSLAPKHDPKQRQFVCGMEADEFVLDDTKERIVYIAKVDSTGAFPKVRGVAARLVNAYLQSMAPCTVHVFARSQPQYLFRESMKHSDKHVLPPRTLIQWWRKVLSQTVKSIALDQKGSFGWWLIPGVEDASSALRETGDSSSSSNSGWTYGYPYDPAARASDVIPRFLDDTKARVLKRNEDDGNDTMSVQDLWLLLAFTEECGSNHQVGFFVAKVPSPAAAAAAGKEKQQEKMVEQEAFTTYWNALMNAYFRNQEENVESTRTLVDAWGQQGMSPPVEIVTCGPSSSTAAEHQPRVDASSSSSPVKINTLFVKRKEVSSATSVVNTLTVKRVKTQQDQVNVLTVKKKDNGK